MTKILIAGGAGFLGSHLVELLLSRGYEVSVVDDFSSGLEANLASVKDRVEVIRANINDFDFGGRIDVVVNLASRASRREWETVPVEVVSSNSVGAQNLIRLALRNKAKYLFASSSEVYGDAEIVPTPETYVGRVDTLGLRSPYDESKRFGETLVYAYVKQESLKGVIMRIFNTYGPRMRAGDIYGRVVDRFVSQALNGQPVTVYGDGSQTRAFTYISDTIDAIVKLVEGGRTGQVYNIGTSTETTVLELAKLVIEKTKSSSQLEFLPLPQGDPRRRAADFSMVKSLGWRPRVALSEGLRLMIEGNRALASRL